MGLDITYYAKARFDREPRDGNDYGEGDGECWVRPNSHFERQADGLRSGIYLADVVGDFRAGSYGGYNQWRDQLAVLAGYPSADAAWKQEESGRTEGPFWELINFSDCEGVIGPQTSAKLASDFAAHQALADKHSDDWFRDRYAHWRKAFETAADNGFVDFH